MDAFGMFAQPPPAQNQQPQQQQQQPLFDAFGTTATQQQQSVAAPAPASSSGSFDFFAPSSAAASSTSSGTDFFSMSSTSSQPVSSLSSTSNSAGFVVFYWFVNMPCSSFYIKVDVRKLVSTNYDVDIERIISLINLANRSIFNFSDWIVNYNILIALFEVNKTNWISFPGLHFFFCEQKCGFMLWHEVSTQL